MSTHHIGRAEAVTIESDEDGFELVITTDQGVYLVNVHAVSEQLLTTVQAQIGTYWDEGRAAARQHALERRTDEEQADAYDLRDPKHPTYHSRMSALADDR